MSQQTDAAYLAHYRVVAPRMMPFLRERPVIVHARCEGELRNPRVEDPVCLESTNDLLDRVAAGAVGFEAGLRDRSGEIWFALALTGPDLPFEVIRLTTLKLLLVLDDLDLAYLVLFDGCESVIILWTWGAADPDELPGGLWGFERTVAARLRDRLEERFAGTSERRRIGRWIGYDGPVTRIGDGLAAGGSVLTMDTHRLSPAGLVRVPYSLHEGTGLAVVPLTRSDLYRFRRQEHAQPARARRLRRQIEVPINFPRETQRLLEV